MASQQGQQGTGKHPHKSTEQPYPHHRSQSGSGGEGQGGERRAEQGGGARSEGPQNASDSSDLKDREYRDKEGNIHHHTRTSEAYREKK